MEGLISGRAYKRNKNSTVIRQRGAYIRGGLIIVFFCFQVDGPRFPRTGGAYKRGGGGGGL